MALNVAKAQKELKTKTYTEVQTETAWTWGSRAAAMYDGLTPDLPLREAMIRWMQAQEYEHEATEHAALVDDGGITVRDMTQALKPYKDKSVGVFLEVTK